MLLPPLISSPEMDEPCFNLFSFAAACDADDAAAETPPCVIKPCWDAVELWGIELFMPRCAASQCSFAELQRAARENGLRLRWSASQWRLAACAEWAPQADIWSSLADLEVALEPLHLINSNFPIDWQWAGVRRLWLRVAWPELPGSVLQRCWRDARKSEARPLEHEHWRWGRATLWLRLQPDADAFRQFSDLGLLQAHRCDLPALCRDLSRNRVEAAGQALFSPLQEVPAWLHMAAQVRFALSWRELALRLGAWHAAPLEALAPMPALPPGDLREWEKSAQENQQQAPEVVEAQALQQRRA